MCVLLQPMHAPLLNFNAMMANVSISHGDAMTNLIAKTVLTKAVLFVVSVGRLSLSDFHV